MSQDPRKPVSVDDLIRVKRGEHPDRGFWSDWDDGMAQRLRKAKQAPRSFWRDALPRFWISVARWQLPVGASALFILGFVVVHEYHRSLPPLPSTLSHSVAAYVQVPSSIELPAPVSVGEEHREPGLGAPVSREPGELTGMIAMGGRAAEGDRSPVSRLVDPSVASSVGTDWRLRQSQEERTQPVTQPRENILGFSYAASPDSSREQRPATGRFRLQADLRLAEGLLRSADRGDRASLRF